MRRCTRTSARGNHAQAIAQIVETMVQSPHFLYRFELGVAEGARRRLTPRELASALSYLFVGSMPDEALFAAADAHELATAAQIEAQARRLRRLRGPADARVGAGRARQGGRIVAGPARQVHPRRAAVPIAAGAPKVVPKPPQPTATSTTRERFAQHSSDPACAGCHKLIDPLGFGLERYDGIGAFRTSENGKPIDSRGEVTGTADVDGPYDGRLELAHKLAASADARRCFALQAYRWANGRFEIDGERELVARIEQSLDGTGLRVADLLVSWIGSTGRRVPLRHGDDDRPNDREGDRW